MNTWKVGEDVGMVVSIAMLYKLTNLEQNSESYMKFGTCRNLRSVTANVYTATSQASYARYYLEILKGVYHLH